MKPTKSRTAEQAAALFSQRGFISSRGTHGETGTGVGTKLVREFVDRHNGQVEAQSEPGQGTTIHITLPDLDNVSVTTRKLTKSFKFKAELDGYLPVRHRAVFNITTGFHHFKPVDITHGFAGFGNRRVNGVLNALLG